MVLWHLTVTNWSEHVWLKSVVQKVNMVKHFKITLRWARTVLWHLNLLTWKAVICLVSKVTREVADSSIELGEVLWTELCVS